MSQHKFNDTRHRLSRETGIIIKDWGGRIPFALIYPNSYYVGMSNLGIHTIYHLLNSYSNVVCERAFWKKDKGDSTITPPIPRIAAPAFLFCQSNIRTGSVFGGQVNVVEEMGFSQT